MKLNRPTFFQIIRSDGLSLFLLWGSFLVAAFAVEFLWGDENGYYYIFSIFTGLILLAGAGLYFRYKRIISIFEDGIEVTGTVTEVHTREVETETSAEIKFGYEFQGTNYNSENQTSKEKAALMKTGQVVTILVDRNKPSRAFVKELFEK